jgi:hypothetical protein
MRPSATLEQIMRAIEQLVALVVSIVLLTAIGFGVYLAIGRVVTVFASLDPEVANVTAIACLTALILALVITRGMTRATRQARTVAVREEKTGTYQFLVDVWADLLGQGTQTDELAGDSSAKLRVLDRLLALYGCAAVIKAHTVLRRLEREKGGRHPDVQAQLGRLLIAIRTDLGADAPRHLRAS